MTELEMLQQELHKHITECDARLDAGDKKFDVIMASNENQQRVLEQLVTNTSGLIQFDKDIRGAVRLGVAIRKSVVWLAQFGGAMALVAVAIDAMLNHIEKVFK